MARMYKSFGDLLLACKRSRFVDFMIEDKTVHGLSLTPVGKMLRDNLRSEWNHMGSMSSGTASIPIFNGSNNISLAENFDFVHKHYSANIPVGVLIEQNRTDHNAVLGDTFTVNLPVTAELCATYLVPSQTANQFIYQLQRQRKIWWMRLSVDPGRYFISDMRRDENRKQTTVSICTRFLERSEAETEFKLEQIELEAGELGEEVSRTVFVREAYLKEKTWPTIVRVRHNLDRAVLAILMDALECAPLEKCVKIHRKISPFKCGIVCHVQDENLRQDMADLSKHLANVLRAGKFSVLDCSSDQQHQQPDTGFQKQIELLDVIGVPYALVVQDQTLQNGLLKLRSRDTTLCETIHVSDLPKYLLQIIHA
ncbi:DNA polymerase subunit gamma-2, mitochondrial [Anopheles nili]|uniref:DNA polymerase subunit gamma-2, mitochondrial n=1 Tax=Anopheles nili TaxID=185578 RepID=UPI00237B4B7B|nr:DNA polymerase subunit gamma-2, mitochondrial [Anopheles nili]